MAACRVSGRGARGGTDAGPLPLVTRSDGAARPAWHAGRVKDSFPPPPLRLRAGPDGRPDLATCKWAWRAALTAYKHPPGVQADVEGWGLDPAAVRAIALRDRWIEVEGFAVPAGDAALVAFRGTLPLRLKDWVADGLFRLVPGPLGRVHEGFGRMIRSNHGDDLVEVLVSRDFRGRPIWLTGHSLGGALAVLAAARLAAAGAAGRVAGVVTFGQPRVGDAGFAAVYDQLLPGRTLRFVNGGDLIPHLPPGVPREVPLDELGLGVMGEVARRHAYRHAGLEVPLGPAGPGRAPPPVANPRFDMELERAVLAALRAMNGGVERTRWVSHHMRLAYHEKMWRLGAL